MPAATANARRRQKAPPAASPADEIVTERLTPPIWLSVGLVALTAEVFAPVRHFAFVSWDDPMYVTENPLVRQGLTAGGVRWAFTTGERFYWHPLTWLSHMADVQILGMQPGAHHVTSLLLHVIGTLLLFWVLRRITGKLARSAFVAALFAVHPLHVESVAWIAERKDVLSGVFWMLTVWAYVRYVRAPGLARYAAVAVLFTLGLMSKPTLVMLPAILLLLDIWPLGRLSQARSAPVPGTARLPMPAAGITRLVVEKIPLFALAAAASVVTFVSQLQVGAVQTLEAIPVEARVANAVVSSVSYIGMALWPRGLAAFYPFRPVDAVRVVVCLLILAAVSYAAFRLRTRRPYVLVGWLWYLLALLPMIGLVQVGSQSMADRFTYLPLIGLLVAFTWGAADVLAWVRVPRIAAGALALAIVAACAVAARAQVGHWKDSETLWQRAIDVVPDNDLAHANLGVVLAASGRSDEALSHLLEALRMIAARGVIPPPEYAAQLHEQIGLLQGRQGRWKEAIDHFREVVRLRPGSPDAHHALAQALAAEGRLQEALAESRESIRLDPGRPELHGEFASVLYRAGDVTGALAELKEALRLGPAHASAAKWHYNTAAMLNERGQVDEAIRELEAALAINPGYEEARRALTRLRQLPRSNDNSVRD